MSEILTAWKVAAEDAHNVLGQVLPYPFPQMIVGGSWSSTIILARYKLVKEMFPLQDWPPDDWCQRAEPVHRMPVSVPLVPSRFHDIASELKKMASGAQGNEKLAGMLEYLEDVAATLQQTGVESPHARAMRHIRRALLTHHVKNISLVSVVASHGLSVFFPESEEQVRQQNQSTKIGDDHFRLDVSLMLTMRDINFRECFARFCLADSSPQGMFDFLMFKEITVAVKDLLRVAEAFRFLQTTRGGVLQGDPEDEVPITMLNRRSEMCKVLSSAIAVHTYPPATLGQGLFFPPDRVSVFFCPFVNA